ncbi:transglycosylase SLT domain-containing protein [Streptomyces sp. NPDC003077]|uniref:transglycosylase SLT domain-containing protein n=1 Tax=Streptomyces sp. NPDC003077 TaxID=3154443 RepID=UPI0033B52076
MNAAALLRSARITKTHKASAVALTAAGSIAALAFTAAPGHAVEPTGKESLAVRPVAADGQPTAKVGAAPDAKKGDQATTAASIAQALKVTGVDAQGHTAKEAANRSTDRKAITADKPASKPAAKPAKKAYADNLDGWIREALDIMKAKGIPGTYEGLHRNIMRESSGNPNAVNDWDINAINGIPSKGLLQVIQPTFDTYHVPGTANKLTDPVANITAAANYAAHRYGSIDNVNSAY